MQSDPRKGSPSNIRDLLQARPSVHAEISYINASVSSCASTKISSSYNATLFLSLLLYDCRVFSHSRSFEFVGVNLSLNLFQMCLFQSIPMYYRWKQCEGERTSTRRREIDECRHAAPYFITAPAQCWRYVTFHARSPIVERRRGWRNRCRALWLLTYVRLTADRRANRPDLTSRSALRNAAGCAPRGSNCFCYDTCLWYPVVNTAEHNQIYIKIDKFVVHLKT